jgi:osmotically-inducible protein OsmY
MYTGFLYAQTASTNSTLTDPPTNGPTPSTTDTDVPADNTGKNKELMESGKPTAMEQSNDKKDVQLAAKVRKAVVKEKSLSTDAHNVKIITNKGMVQIVGPVASENEKKTLERIVRKVVGDPKKIQMDVEVTNTSK